MDNKIMEKCILETPKVDNILNLFKKHGELRYRIIEKTSPNILIFWKLESMVSDGLLVAERSRGGIFKTKKYITYRLK
jgi:hypothetical protein